MSQNIPVRTEDDAAAAISRQIEDCIADLRRTHTTSGFNEEMRRFCADEVLPTLRDFANRNRDGTVEDTIVVGRYELESHREDYQLVCQVAIEVDADSANPDLGQTPHFGCEVYWANREACSRAGGTLGPRRGVRERKIHALLPDGHTPPYVRPASERAPQPSTSYQHSTQSGTVKQSGKPVVIYKATHINNKYHTKEL